MTQMLFIFTLSNFCALLANCGMKPETAEKVKDLERKLAVLDNHIAILVLDEGIRTEIIERCGSELKSFFASMPCMT